MQRQSLRPTLLSAGHSLVGAGLFLVSAWIQAATLPALPQTFIDTTYSPPAGNVLTVNAGGSLQTALNNAQLGDTIILQAGATFTGPFTLPNKTSGTGWIYIRSSAYASLPTPGTRVSPSDAANMPKIVGTSAGGSAIRTASGAHHYRFVGIEFKPAAGNFLYNLVQVGNGETNVANLPTDLVFDRCYVHGDPSAGGRRGIAMDGVRVAVIDSHVSDFKEVGFDSQGLWAYNTPGPIKIVNNFIEGAGENVMFGGADPAIANAIPSDIEISRNHFFKPTGWMGMSWSVKNLLEFKNAQRVVVEGNLFENNWPGSQNGFSILFTPRNQDGKCPWCVVRDVTFQFNKVLNVGQGINILGRDSPNLSQPTERIHIRDNFLNVTSLGGASGRAFQFLSGPSDVTVDHNTVFTSGTMSMSENTPLANQFVFTNNVVEAGLYGFIGTGTGTGVPSLVGHFTNYLFTRNAVVGSGSTTYPAGNFFPGSRTAVGFVNLASGDYSLSSSSPFKLAGTDGKDLGADFLAIAAAMSGATPLGAPRSLRVVP